MLLYFLLEIAKKILCLERQAGNKWNFIVRVGAYSIFNILPRFCMYFGIREEIDPVFLDSSLWGFIFFLLKAADF